MLLNVALIACSLLLLDDPLSQYRQAAIDKWETEIRSIEARDGNEKDPEHAILFIGSSSIRRWESIARDLAPWPTIQRGYGGAKFSDLAVFAERIVYPHKFDALVIFVGNDITGGKEDKTVDEVVRLFKNVVQTVRRKYEHQPIFLIEITPTPSRFAAWSKIRELNSTLRSVCQADPTLHFIATSEKYLDPAGQPIAAYFGSDRLHQNSDGYSQWSKLIKAEFEKVLTAPKTSSPKDASATSAPPKNLQRDQLVAWCIVPFDASKRGPKERAAMLLELGLKRLAYDWREEHVATWDEEVDTLAANGIELTAFWCASSLDPLKDPSVQRIVQLLTRRKVATELWVMLPDNQLGKISDEQQRVETAAKALRLLADQVRPLGCKIGLYNHGGWIGRPSTMIRVMQALKGTDNVGIVYNLHHAHDDLAEFPSALASMKPYLLCVNLNGTTPAGPKIQPIGSGTLDAEILRWIEQADYRGAIGILGHRPELDAKESLLKNLNGLQQLLGK